MKDLCRPSHKIVIWAEESAALASAQPEWSYGNGATGNIGIPLPEEWEAYAVSFNAEVFVATDSVTIAVRDTNLLTNLLEFTATSGSYTEILATPVTIPAGTELGFFTVTEVGAVTDARAAVWLRQYD